MKLNRKLTPAMLLPVVDKQGWVSMSIEESGEVCVAFYGEDNIISKKYPMLTTHIDDLSVDPMHLEGKVAAYLKFEDSPSAPSTRNTGTRTRQWTSRKELTWPKVSRPVITGFLNHNPESETTSSFSYALLQKEDIGTLKILKAIKSAKDDDVFSCCLTTGRRSKRNVDWHKKTIINAGFRDVLESWIAEDQRNAEDSLQGPRQV